MAAKWFYSRDGVKNGPLTSRELKTLARSGEIRATDLLWKQGMSDWRPAGEAERLFRGSDDDSAFDGGEAGGRTIGRRRDEEPEAEAADALQPRPHPAPTPAPARTEPAAGSPSRFRAWALRKGLPPWLLEPIPVAGGVALVFLCLWGIVWLITLSSPDTRQMVDDVKEAVIAEAGEAVTRAADAAKRGLSGDDEPAPATTDAAGAPPDGAPAKPPSRPALENADF